MFAGGAPEAAASGLRKTLEAYASGSACKVWNFALNSVGEAAVLSGCGFNHVRLTVLSVAAELTSGLLHSMETHPNRLYEVNLPLNATQVVSGGNRFAVLGTGALSGCPGPGMPVPGCHYEVRLMVFSSRQKAPEHDVLLIPPAGIVPVVAGAGSGDGKKFLVVHYLSSLLKARLLSVDLASGVIESQTQPVLALNTPVRGVNANVDGSIVQVQGIGQQGFFARNSTGAWGSGSFIQTPPHPGSESFSRDLSFWASVEPVPGSVLKRVAVYADFSKVNWAPGVDYSQSIPTYPFGGTPVWSQVQVGQNVPIATAIDPTGALLVVSTQGADGVGVWIHSLIAEASGLGVALAAPVFQDLVPGSSQFDTSQVRFIDRDTIMLLNVSSNLHFEGRERDMVIYRRSSVTGAWARGEHVVVSTALEFPMLPQAHHSGRVVLGFLQPGSNGVWMDVRIPIYDVFSRDLILKDIPRAGQSLALEIRGEAGQSVRVIHSDQLLQTPEQVPGVGALLIDSAGNYLFRLMGIIGAQGLLPGSIGPAFAGAVGAQHHLQVWFSGPRGLSARSVDYRSVPADY